MQDDAIYRGEMSALNYSRDFYYADSGMIPWLLIAQLVSQSGKSLAELVEDRRAAFPSSGEINFTVADAPAAIARVLAHYAEDNPTIDRTDGISAEFADWRSSLRSSNTEPLLRLNLETLDDADLLARRTQQVADIIQSSAEGLSA